MPIDGCADGCGDRDPGSAAGMVGTLAAMTETADRYRRVAEGLTARVEAVPSDAWERPAPCDGWVARDILQHVVDTTGFFLGRAGADLGELPPVEEDPLGAWVGARDAMLSALDDPAVAASESETPVGTFTFEQTVGIFGVGDILVHTWDLSRATGQDETLDPDEVHRTYESLLPNDVQMRGANFGPKVEVPDSADEQTKLIAFTGRHP